MAQLGKPVAIVSGRIKILLVQSCANNETTQILCPTEPSVYYYYYARVKKYYATEEMPLCLLKLKLNSCVIYWREKEEQRKSFHVFGTERVRCALRRGGRMEFGF